MGKTILFILLVTIAMTKANVELGPAKMLIFDVKEREGRSPRVELLEESDINIPLDKTLPQNLQAQDDVELGQGKILVFEVTEREGKSPQVELLKVSDIDVPLDKALAQNLEAQDDVGQAKILVCEVTERDGKLHLELLKESDINAPLDKVLPQHLQAQDDVDLGKAKILVLEVTEREGKSPHVELLKVSDVNVPLGKDLSQLIQAQDDTHDYDDRIQYRINKNGVNRHRWVKVGQIKEPYLKLLSNKHKNKKVNKNKIKYLQRSLYQQALDKYKSEQNNRQDKNDTNFWKSSIADFIKQQSDKRNKKTKHHRIHVADNNLDEYLTKKYDRDIPVIILNQQDEDNFDKIIHIKAKDDSRDDYYETLAQLLNPKIRNKRQAKQLSLTQKIKTFVERLKRADENNEANLEGTFRIIDQIQNPLRAVRSGGNLPDGDEDEPGLVEDRTAPPRPDHWHD